jgi:transcriptional regulator with XRE-family HTH domain
MRDMTFAEKLQKLMGNREQREIAKAIDVAPSALSNYLNRKSMPGVDIALRLSKFFGCSLAWLVDDQRDWESPERSLAVDLAARYVAEASKLRKQLQEAEKIDWVGVAKAIDKGPEIAPLSADAPLNHPQFGATSSDNSITASSRRCGLALIFSSMIIPMV